MRFILAGGQASISKRLRLKIVAFIVRIAPATRLSALSGPESVTFVLSGRSLSM